jgi:putative transposase
MMYPLVLDLAADGVPVTVTCRVLGFSTQAFYKWRKSPLTQRDWDDAHLIDAALTIHADDPAFGYRFIADELATHGIVAGENRVARLCSQESIWSIFAKKRGLNRRSGPPVHDDLVDRRFSAKAVNDVWLTDLTEHRTDEGKLYLCAIKDVYSNRIVGYSIDSRMKASLAVAAWITPSRSGHPSGRSFIPIGAVNCALACSFMRCWTTAYVDPWAVSVHVVTMRRWSPSLRCFNATSCTGNGGPPALNSAWRS